MKKLLIILVFLIGCSPSTNSNHYYVSIYNTGYTYKVNRGDIVTIELPSDFVIDSKKDANIVVDKVIDRGHIYYKIKIFKGDQIVFRLGDRFCYFYFSIN